MPAPTLPPDLRAVVFDVGETLVDESRAWADLARAAGTTPFTLMAAIGATIGQGRDHRDAWRLLGLTPPTVVADIRAEDLYDDALACLTALRAAGLTVGVAGNQPAGAEEALRSAGVRVDFVATSATWGVAKPSAAFFARVAAACGTPAHRVLYVGDRLDNDVLAAREAGMRTAWLRRGPWAHVQAPDARDRADLEIGSLVELADLVRATGGR